MKEKTSTNSRREFLKTSLKAGAAVSLLVNPVFTNAESMLVKGINKSYEGKKLKILILGGTSFLGPQQIAYALDRGHSITIFTRGKTKPTVNQQLFDKVEHLTGDRKDNLKALENRSWDAVIDNSGYDAQWTKDSAELLKNNVGLYLYTSSTGVYYPYLGSDITEETKLILKVPENINEEQKMEYDYGVMKANSEIEAIKAFGNDRTIIVRPTYMMGPGDRTDRFTYWPVRLSIGGQVLVPGKADDPVQYIDVRDVSHWMIELIEQKNTGTFNAVGPASATGMHAFVYGAHAAFSSPVSYVMIPDYAFLKSQKVFYSIPWIMPESENYGSARVSNKWGVENGLAYTPLAQSVADIYTWWNSGVVSPERMENLISGPDSLMAREASIISEWEKLNKTK